MGPESMVRVDMRSSGRWRLGRISLCLNLYRRGRDCSWSIRHRRAGARCRRRRGRVSVGGSPAGREMKVGGGVGRGSLGRRQTRCHTGERDGNRRVASLDTELESFFKVGKLGFCDADVTDGNPKKPFEAWVDSVQRK